ncbi:MAG TPA: hypothetical protein VGL55_04725 [Steroidobacteraceae bacterium]|jgi:hypothetical protein
MTTVSAAEGTSSWIETQYCASVAGALLARAEYFELLEDACVTPGRLSSALRAWRDYVSQAEALAQFPMPGEEGLRS